MSFKVKVGGIFGFNKLPEDVQSKIKDRLASKDAVMAQGKLGILPGVRIDGKIVTKENIHEFEKKSELDLNKDGRVDKKDASLAGKVLAETKKLTNPVKKKVK